MSNKDLCQIKTFFHLGKALDLTVPQRKIVIKTKVHIVQTTKLFYVHTRGIHFIEGNGFLMISQVAFDENMIN